MTAVEAEPQRRANARGGVSTTVHRKVRWTRPSTWPAYWSLVAVVVPYPIWWVLGLSNVIWMVMAVPLGYQLVRRRPVRLPRGAAWWALYLVWFAASAAALWVDAPSGVPGGATERLPVFVVRFAWVLAATVVMLWACNIPESEAPRSKVIRLIGWMFVVTTAGGWLGVIAPGLELRSLAQIVLPAGVQSSHFVRDMIGIPVAPIFEILGTAAGRPVAPFAFANSWGANLSMFLPFFVVGWCGRSVGWKRWPAIAVLVAALVPAVASLNRGLWISLLVGALYLFVRTAVRGRALVALGGALVVLVLAVVVAVGPLGDTIQSRLANPHSNQRRGDLLQTTVIDTWSTSPIIGFGSTRDVRGSFASIAGGSTPECPACSPPPLGTQGQLWGSIFSQGFVGAALFLAFFAFQLLAHWRSRSKIESIAVTVLLFFFVQLFVYDALDISMMVVLLAVGLAERTHPGRISATGADWGRWLRASWRIVTASVAVGVLVGAALGLRVPATYGAAVPVELAPVPVHLGLDDGQARSTTVDTEASMVFAERALAEVQQRTGERPDRSDIQVTAAPTTRVMYVTVFDEDPERAARMGEALAAAYLELRGDYLAQRKEQVLYDLRRELATASSRGELVEIEVDGAPMKVRAEDVILDQIEDVTASSANAGIALRTPTVTTVRRPIEMWVVSGAAVGLLVGLGIGLLRRPRLSMA